MLESITHQLSLLQPTFCRYLTPLREAIGGGHLGIVKHLVEVHRVDLHLGRPDSGSLPHNYAASLGHLDIVRYLVSCGKGLCVKSGSSSAWKERHNDPDTDSFVLRSACESGNAELVRFVLSEGCEVNTPDPVNGGTPLECACASGNIEIVQLVHEHGAVVDVSRTCDCCLDWTPVHEAVATGSADIVDYLIRSGSTQISTQCTGKDRITPLDLAFEMGQRECAKVLFCHGAVLYCNRAQHELRQDFIRLLPRTDRYIHCVSRWNYVRSQLLKYVDAGFRYAFGFRNGWTNLQLCADFRRPDIARWLLEQGLADPAACSAGSPSPAALATRTSRFSGAPPALRATQRLFRDAERPWRISTHMLFGPGFRRTVRALMLVHKAHSLRNGFKVTLPLEMWLAIASMMRRSDHDNIQPLCRVSFGVDVNADDLQLLVANIGDALDLA